jgi:SSS family transporter
MDTGTAIFTGVAIYMLAMIAVGFYASRKTHSVTEFVVAGRGLPAWLCATTIVATWFGGGTMIGVSGSAYANGMLGVIADPIGAALCLFFIGLFFARLFRRLKILTVADFMQQRYGLVAAMAITVSALFSNITWVGAMLVAFGLIFESLTGTPLIVGIVAGAIVIFIYTTVGGLWAVALTDFLQMIILVVGLVMLLAVVLIDAGGWGAVAAKLPEDTFRLLPREATGADWLNYLRAWVIIGLVDISAQSLIQRAAAARTERVAQNSFYLGAAGYLVFGMIPVMLGIIASVSMPGITDAEAIVPSLAIEHLHPVAIAVFVGALLAAIMSSADSALLACASLLAKNVLPLVKHDATDRQSLVVARVAIPVCGSISIIVAVNFQVVFDLMLDANILGLAAIIVPFVLGVWWTKANRSGALAGMAAGLSAWLLTLLLSPGLPADFIGLGACLLTMLVVTPLTQKLDPPRPLVDADGRAVEFRDRLGTLPLFRRG